MVLLKWKVLQKITTEQNVEIQAQLLEEIERREDVKAVMNNFKRSGQLQGLMVNRFPYMLEEGIFHYVLWNQNWKATKCEISQHLPSNVVWCYFTNPPNRRSMPYIPHHHIFVRSGTTITKLVHIFPQLWNLDAEQYCEGKVAGNSGKLQVVKWDSNALANLWEMPQFSRWKVYMGTLGEERRKVMLFLSPLLIYGGVVAKRGYQGLKLEDGGVQIGTGENDSQYGQNQEMNNFWIASVPFCPYIYEYFDYICLVGRYSESPPNDGSLQTYHHTLEQWEREVLKIR